MRRSAGGENPFCVVSQNDCPVSSLKTGRWWWRRTLCKNVLRWHPLTACTYVVDCHVLANRNRLRDCHSLFDDSLELSRDVAWSAGEDVARKMSAEASAESQPAPPVAFAAIEVWTDVAATCFAEAPVPPDVGIAVSAMLRRTAWFALHHRRPTHNADGGKEVDAFAVVHSSGRFVLDFEKILANGWVTVAHAAFPGNTFTWWGHGLLVCECNARHRRNVDGVQRGRHDTTLAFLGNSPASDVRYRGLFDVALPPFLACRRFTDASTGESVFELSQQNGETCPLLLYPDRVRRENRQTRSLKCVCSRVLSCAAASAEDFELDGSVLQIKPS